MTHCEQKCFSKIQYTGFAKKIITITMKQYTHLKLDTYYLQIMANCYLSFFCQIVEVVIAIKAIIVATKPIIGIF